MFIPLDTGMILRRSCAGPSLRKFTVGQIFARTGELPVRDLLYGIAHEISAWRAEQDFINPHHRVFVLAACAWYGMFDNSSKKRGRRLHTLFASSTAE